MGQKHLHPVPGCVGKSTQEGRMRTPSWACCLSISSSVLVHSHFTCGERWHQDGRHLPQATQEHSGFLWGVKSGSPCIREGWEAGRTTRLVRECLLSRNSGQGILLRAAYQAGLPGLQIQVCRDRHVGGLFSNSNDWHLLCTVISYNCMPTPLTPTINENEDREPYFGYLSRDDSHCVQRGQNGSCKNHC